jgi:hypothetical protein
VINETVESEIKRINERLPRLDDKSEQYGKLYAAQQALSWALNQTAYKAPYDMIMGIQGDSKDCLDELRPIQS